MNKIILRCELFSSKNHKRLVRNQKTGAMYFLPSLKAVEEEETIAYELTENEKKWKEMIANKQKPYKLHIFIYKKRKSRSDYINIVQSLFDMMTKCEWWEDDNMDVVAPCFEGYSIDKEDPRVELWVE